MDNPFELDDDDVVVQIQDENGQTASMRHLATVQYAGKTYLVLSAEHKGLDGTDEKGLMLVREEETLDGVREYVVATDRDEIERVVDHAVLAAMHEAMEEEDEEELECLEDHEPGTFCYCGQTNYLQ